MKKTVLFAATAVMTMAMGITAFAGTWKSDANGWWYDNGNGSYPAAQWDWIDGNNDGIAECYYFDQNGYALMNTSSPDGYQLNESGAWVLNGVVQTKQVTANASNGSNSIVAADSGVYKTDSSEKAGTSDDNKSSADASGKLVKQYAVHDNNGEETAMGTFWNNGVHIVNYGYMMYKLDGKYSELSFEAAHGKANSGKTSTTNAAARGGNYSIDVIGDDDVLESENILTDAYKIWKIKADVSGREYVTIKWSSDSACNHNILLRNITLK